MRWVTPEGSRPIFSNLPAAYGPYSWWVRLKGLICIYPRGLPRNLKEESVHCFILSNNIRNLAQLKIPHWSIPVLRYPKLIGKRIIVSILKFSPLKYKLIHSDQLVEKETNRKFLTRLYTVFYTWGLYRVKYENLLAHTKYNGLLYNRTSSFEHHSLRASAINWTVALANRGWSTREAFASVDDRN